MRHSLRLAAVVLLSASPMRAVDIVNPHKGTCSATPPAVTVTSVTAAAAGTPCPTENQCFKVDWTANANGQTLTGFKVDLKVTADSKTFSGTASTDGAARTAVVKIFMNGALARYDATVKADFAGCVSGSKAAAF